MKITWKYHQENPLGSYWKPLKWLQLHCSNTENGLPSRSTVSFLMNSAHQISPQSFLLKELPLFYSKSAKMYNNVLRNYFGFFLVPMITLNKPELWKHVNPFKMLLYSSIIFFFLKIKTAVLMTKLAYGCLCSISTYWQNN